MIRDYSALETLDLSDNYIGNDGAKDIAAMIEENKTIKKLKLTNCHIGTKGLQVIVSALSKEGCENLEFLDIRGNAIPDKQLKILLVLMYNNRNIREIDYSLCEEKNIEKRIAARIKNLIYK